MWDYYVKGSGVSSKSNNTTEILAGAGTYTGTAELNFQPHVMVSCFSDTAGTLYFDFASTVNTPSESDWRTFPSSGFRAAAGIHEFHTAVKGPRWFRVRFVNGSDAQTTFQLATYFGSDFVPSVAPLNQTAGLDQDAIFTRGTIAQDEIRTGKRAGVEGWTKFAIRDGLTAAGGHQTIWTASGNFTPMTSAETFDISYTQADDGSSANGAKTLVFYYVDDDGLPALSVHTLGSDGSDTTSFSGLGINRIAVSSSGSANTNVSDIEVTATTAGTVQAHIPAGYGVTQT